MGNSIENNYPKILNLTHNYRNINQNNNETPYITYQIGKYKKINITQYYWQESGETDCLINSGVDPMFMPKAHTILEDF